jgi:hypothetical protein
MKRLDAHKFITGLAFEYHAHFSDLSGKVVVAMMDFPVRPDVRVQSAWMLDVPVKILLAPARVRV